MLWYQPGTHNHRYSINTAGTHNHNYSINTAGTQSHRYSINKARMTPIGNWSIASIATLSTPPLGIPRGTNENQHCYIADDQLKTMPRQNENTAANGTDTKFKWFCTLIPPAIPHQRHFLRFNMHIADSKLAISPFTSQTTASEMQVSQSSRVGAINENVSDSGQSNCSSDLAHGRTLWLIFSHIRTM